VNFAKPLCHSAGDGNGKQPRSVKVKPPGTFGLPVRQPRSVPKLSVYKRLHLTPVKLRKD